MKLNLKLKLKYKKLIVIVSMCVLGIAMLSFSILNKPDATKEAGKTLQEDESQITALDSVADENGDATTTEPIATPTPEPEPVFEVNAYSDVNELISQYLNAELNPTVEQFSTLINDVSLLDVEAIDRETTFIESVQNINCYTIDGPKEGTRLVYAYHDIKFTGIESLVPAINEFIVVTTEEQKPQIYFGNIDEEMETFISEFRQSETFMNLTYEVNDKLQQVLETDPVLSEFYAKLQEQGDDSASAN